jgi:hypothetical protein
MAVSLFVVVHSAAARAQTDTGTIRVRFSSRSDGSVPSIAVTLMRVDARDNLLSRSCRPTAQITFAHLRPGEYRLHTHGGESPDADGPVRVGPGEDVRVVVTLPVAVGDANPIVSVVSRLPGPYSTTFGSDAVRALPSSMNLWSLIDIAELFTFAGRPDTGGVVTGEAELLGAHGTSWTQTTFHLDTVDATDLTEGGMPLWYPDIDALEDVSIVSASAPVEIATPGPVLTMLARDAGGSWHAEASGGATPVWLQSRSHGAPPAIATLTSWDRVGAVGGGPIANIRTGVVVSGTITRSRHIERSSAAELPGDVDSLTARGNNVFSSAQRLNLFASAQRTTHAYSERGRLLDTLATEHDRFLDVQAQWQRQGASPFWVDAALQSVRMTPDVAADAPNGTIERLRDGPVPALATATDGSRRRWTLAAGMAWNLDRFDRGRHAVRTGATLSGTSAELTSAGSGPIGELLNGTPARAWIYTPPLKALESRETVFAAYASDRVAVSDWLTVEAGFRTDVLRAASGAGDRIDWQTLSPRVSARWTTEADRWSAFGSYGRYQFALPLVNLTLGDPAVPQGSVFRWTDPNGDRIVQASELGLMIAHTGKPSSIDPSLDRPVADEFVLGVDRRLGRSWQIRFAGLSRRERRLMAVVNAGAPASSYAVRYVFDPGLDLLGPEDDQMLPVYDRLPETFGRDRYVLTNPAGLDAAYDGLDLAIAGTVGGRLRLAVGGTTSRSHGPAANRGFLAIENDQGLLGEVLIDPNAGTNADGHVFFERGYSGKLSALYDGPRGVRAAVAARYQDGQNFARLLIAPDLAQGPEAIRAYPNGLSRFTYAFTLDARVDKEVRLGVLHAGFGLEGYNLLETANEVEEDVATGPGFRRSTARQPPRVLRLVFRLAY